VACMVTGSTKTLNCVGGLQVNGTSVLTTAAISGTTNKIAKFTGTNAVGNSLISDDGTTVTIAAGTGGTTIGINGDNSDTGIGGQLGVRISPSATAAIYVDGSGLTHALSAIGAGLFTGNLTTNANTTLGDATTDTATISGILHVGAAQSSPELVNFSHATRTVARFLNGATATGFIGSANALFSGGAVSTIGLYSVGTLYLGADNDATADFTLSSGDGTFSDDLTVTDVLTVNGNTQLGDASTDRVGIGIAPDSNHAMTFAAAVGAKIALYPDTSTTAYGFGVQAGQLQYFVPASTGFHSFGYGDSDAFTESQRFDADGQVWLGDTASTAVSSNVDVFNIGQTGTGQTSDEKSIIYATNTGTYNTTSADVWVYGVRSSMAPTRSSGSNIVQAVAFYAEAPSATGVTPYSFYGETGTIYNAGSISIGANTTLGDGTTRTITLNGKLNSKLIVSTSGSIPTMGTCGTSPTIIGGEHAGTVTVGTGTATSCAVVFGSSYSTNAPSCVVTSHAANANPLYLSAISTSGFTVATSASTNLAGQKFSFHCTGLL
jgi:hypothetical protein